MSAAVALAARPIFGFEVLVAGAVVRVLCDGEHIYRRAVACGATALGEVLALDALDHARILDEHAVLERIEAVPVRLGPPDDSQRRPEPCQSRFLRPRRSR